MREVKRRERRATEIGSVRIEEPWSATAVQDAGASPDDCRNARSVLECASPLALLARRGENERRREVCSVACGSQSRAPDAGWRERETVETVERG